MDVPDFAVGPDDENHGVSDRADHARRASVMPASGGG
jgi:hypothetical protein